MGLADCEDRIESIGQRKPVAELPQQWLVNGFATIAFPCGTHKTLRIHTQKGGPFAGKRLVSLLIGPDNTMDYEAFGELIPAESVVWVWKRWKGTRIADYAELLVTMARGEKVEGHELLISAHCLRCNRILTTPESIAKGIGPECEKRG